MAAGAVLVLPMAGWLVGRLGSRGMTFLAALGFSLALPLPLLSPTVELLVLALIVLGAANGTLDISMNAQAVEIERGYGRPIMSSFHALFSVGGVAGAILAGAAMSLEVDPRHHLVALALGSALIVAAVVRWLVPAPVPRDTAPVFAPPGRALLGLGLPAFLGLLTEGAMADWTAVYLSHALMTSHAVASVGFAAFSLTMAAGRFGGDWLVGRFGCAAVLRTSASIAAPGARWRARPRSARAGDRRVRVGGAGYRERHPHSVQRGGRCPRAPAWPGPGRRGGRRLPGVSHRTPADRVCGGPDEPSPRPGDRERLLRSHRRTRGWRGHRRRRATLRRPAARAAPGSANPITPASASARPPGCHAQRPARGGEPGRRRDRSCGRRR